MHRLPRIVLFAASIALLTTALAACGGGGGALSLEDYFAQLEELNDARSEKQDGIETDYEDKLNPTEFSDEVIDDFVSFFEESRENQQDFVDEMNDLDPPDEAAEAHGDAIAAFADCLEETGKLADDISDAESFEDLTALFSSEDVNEACGGTTAACEDLQEIADENDIDATLDCGE